MRKSNRLVWRVYKNDQVSFTTPKGYTLVVKMSADLSHAVVEFDEELADGE